MKNIYKTVIAVSNNSKSNHSHQVQLN